MQPQGITGELIAAAGGIGLLAFSFVAWFGAEGESASAWQTFTLMDVVLLACALLPVGAAAVAIASDRGFRVRPAAAAGRAVLAAGALALVITLAFTIEFSTGEGIGSLVSPRIGAFLSLLSAAAIVAGGYLIERPELLGRARRPSPPAQAAARRSTRK